MAASSRRVAPEAIRADAEVRQAYLGEQDKTQETPRKEPMSDRCSKLSGVETCYGLSQVLFGIALAIAPARW